jgi:hypothetical protein
MVGYAYGDGGMLQVVEMPACFRYAMTFRPIEMIMKNEI